MLVASEPDVMAPQVGRACTRHVPGHGIVCCEPRRLGRDCNGIIAPPSEVSTKTHSKCGAIWKYPPRHTHTFGGVESPSPPPLAMPCSTAHGPVAFKVLFCAWKRIGDICCAREGGNLCPPPPPVPPVQPHPPH